MSYSFFTRTTGLSTTKRASNSQWITYWKFYLKERTKICWSWSCQLKGLKCWSKSITSVVSEVILLRKWCFCCLPWNRNISIWFWSRWSADTCFCFIMQLKTVECILWKVKHRQRNYIGATTKEKRKYSSAKCFKKIRSWIRTTYSIRI